MRSSLEVRLMREACLRPELVEFWPEDGSLCW